MKKFVIAFLLGSATGETTSYFHWFGDPHRPLIAWLSTAIVIGATNLIWNEAKKEARPTTQTGGNGHER